MPGSDARSPWSRPLLAGLGTLVLALGLVAGRVVWFDPYWEFRTEPPWRQENEGRNRLLDRQMRRAKSLQAMTRAYDVALVGSSTTYHGLDPADADPGPRVYNAGISGILANELPTIAGIVASRSEVRRVAIGLDYYMFSRTDAAVRLDPDLATPLGRTAALLGSLVGRYAIHDAWASETGRRTDPGRWTYDGFRITPKLSAADTRLNDATRRRTTVQLQTATFAGIEAALTALAGREIDLYLAPVSRAQRRVLADRHLTEDFDRWRADMAAIAKRRGVRFHDLTALGSEDAFDPDRGSTDLWLDNLHYTPVIGRQVLAALGLRARP